MPGTPGPRHTGGSLHASDAVHRTGADTPHDSAVGMPMTGRTVGATPYLPHDHRTGERARD